MKHVRKAIAAGYAFLCTTLLSFGWSDYGPVPLWVASAQARVGRPATPVSAAGVARRQVRHGAHLGDAGGTALGAAAAIGSTYNGYYGDDPYYRDAGYGYGYDAGPYGAYAAEPYAAGAAVPYGAYGYGYYRLDCAPGPRVGAFATQPWDDVPTCPPY